MGDIGGSFCVSVCMCGKVLGRLQGCEEARTVSFGVRLFVRSIG